MIEFTDMHTNRQILINKNHIVAVFPMQNKCTIHTTVYNHENSLLVKESYEETKDKINNFTRTGFDE